MIVIQKHEKKKLYHGQFRQQMVETQLKPNLIVSNELLNVFLAVDRENYVFKEQKSICYSDQLIPLKNGRFLLPPLTIATILQNISFETGKKVLVIGAGLGYTLALFLELGLHVVGIDHEFFVDHACKVHPYLKEFYSPASLIAGRAEKGPFDVIFIEGGIQSIPANIITQLKENGQLATLIYQGGHAPYIGTVFQRRKQVLHPIYVFDTVGYLLPDFKKEEAFKF
jgi:protein-L-isoaspartate(D-aspartate) O-methyltransferase